MACGSGKTLVALWTTERLRARTVLVLLPSLALVRQTLHEWLHETSWSDVQFLCVCSDPTEDKIRILREGDRGKSILEVCRAHNISEVSFHRWKRPFGQMDLNEARKLKELERENGELKKMLAEALLKNRVLEAVAERRW